KTALSFDNGTVQVKPFTLKYKDMAINVAGGHTFDKQMKYTATLDVPAKYLGTEVNNLIAQLNDNSLQEVTVPVTANIGGSFTDPTVSTDLTSGVKTLTTKLVEIQKQKLVNKGKDTAKELLSDVFKKTEGDTTTTTKTSGVKETLGNLLGGEKTTTTDTTKTTNKQEDVKNTAKSVLGGLLGKKKKDTVN
ncbi:MAG: AsmA-like C-terminal region-containing protein, partial [Bacteroidota bacterium]|nr:AsmA-like C-terminal region-containing protein [Bacteroidota bacterium]